MNPIDLLSTVNQFYDQAFNRLLAITFGLLALIGIIVPVAVGWVQLRNLRAEKSSLLNDLRSDIGAEREEIEKKIDQRVEERLQAFKTEHDAKFEETSTSIKKSFSSAQARAYHLQGNVVLHGNHNDYGVSDFSHAVSLYFVAEEEGNVRRCIETILESCLPRINSATCKEHSVEQTCKRLIETLAAQNANSRYVDDIKSLEREAEKAANRPSAQTARIDA